jgi:hypothetical protein
VIIHKGDTTLKRVGVVTSYPLNVAKAQLIQDFITQRDTSENTVTTSQYEGIPIYPPLMLPCKPSQMVTLQYIKSLPPPFTIDMRHTSNELTPPSDTLQTQKRKKDDGKTFSPPCGKPRKKPEHKKAEKVKVPSPSYTPPQESHITHPSVTRYDHLSPEQQRILDKIDIMRATPSQLITLINMYIEYMSKQEEMMKPQKKSSRHSKANIRKRKQKKAAKAALKVTPTTPTV